MFYLINKFVFYHIPKNAGTMLSSVIKEKYQNSEDLMLPLRGFWTRYDYEHKPLHWFLDNMIIPLHLPIITTSRNPYRRMVSVYFHCTKNKKQKAHRRKYHSDTVPINLIKYYENQSFVDFLNGKVDFSPYKIHREINITFEDVIKMRDWNWYNSQSYFLKNVNTDKIKVFKIEEPEKINEYFDININSWDGETNKSEHLDKDKNLWRTFYNKETLKLVRDRYAEDFERFGYSTHIDDA